MPWVVAEEISKVVKTGGMVGIETHFSFSEHERPWHFFQFNPEGLKILFNSRLGFEVVDAGFSNPMVGRFSIDAVPPLVGVHCPHLYGHASVLVKKTCHVLGRKSPAFDWRGLIDTITSQSSYPKGTGLSSNSPEVPR
jgi:hypothetical protein